MTRKTPRHKSGLFSYRPLSVPLKLHVLAPRIYLVHDIPVRDFDYTFGEGYLDINFSAA